MGQKPLAKLSVLLTIAMVVATFTVWRASTVTAEPSMTVGVKLLSAKIDSATYELVVTNRGAGPSEDAQLSYLIPRRATFVALRGAQAPGTGCRDTAGPGTECIWDIGALAPEEVRSIPILLRLAPGRGSHAINSSAKVIAGDSIVSSHSNRSLRLSDTAVAPSMCRGATRDDVVTAAGDSLTGGLPLERLWDWGIDCTNPLSPRQVTAAQTVAPPTCVDVDPETVSTPEGDEQRLDALVTDGTATNRTAAGVDSCSGNPVPNTEVVWEVEDDTPDVYFSKNEVFVTSGQPNAISSITDSGTNAGKTYVFVRKVASGAGDNRITGRLPGVNVNEKPTTPTAEASCLLFPPCPGQADGEDDIVITWIVGATTSPSSSASPSTSTSASPTSTTAPTSSASPSPSVSATTPRPSGSASPSKSPSPSPTGVGLARTVTLFASKPKVGYQGTVTFSGRIFSSNSSCDDQGESVRIRSRIHGANEFKDITTQQTDSQGNFQFTTKLESSADYVAVAPSHDVCAEAASASVTVLVKVRISIRAADPTLRQGGTLVLTGKVTPKHSGAVLIQYQKGKRWVRVGLSKLNKRSGYRASVPVNWQGVRNFRAKFQKQDQDHQPNKTKSLAIKAS